MTRSNFKEAMAHLASGISVLTCKTGKENFGMTISSLRCVGVNPPTVSVCVEGQSRMVQAIREARSFGVTVLRQEQLQIGRHFADSDLSHADRFKHIRYEMIDECPVIAGGLAEMACAVVQEVCISENVVFYGEVIHVKSQPGEPLVYYYRDWRELAEQN